MSKPWTDGRVVKCGPKYSIVINRNGSTDLYRNGSYGRSAANPEHEMALRIADLEDRLKELGRPVEEADYPEE